MPVSHIHHLHRSTLFEFVQFRTFPRSFLFHSSPLSFLHFLCTYFQEKKRKRKNYLFCRNRIPRFNCLKGIFIWLLNFSCSYIYIQWMFSFVYAFCTPFQLCPFSFSLLILCLHIRVYSYSRSMCQWLYTTKKKRLSTTLVSSLLLFRVCNKEKYE